jgi:hypothetical protein
MQQTEHKEIAYMRFGVVVGVLLRFQEFRHVEMKACSLETSGNTSPVTKFRMAVALTAQSTVVVACL